jgi:diaminopimelate epimerase
MRFVKGHGTENDFVLLPDLDDELVLEPSAVVEICDRRRGLGADGVLRVVRRDGGLAQWFMDYRNADGSLAEMCGNGIRVFARYLVDAGLASPGRLLVDTRDGVKTVEVPARGDVTVDMGFAEKLPDAKVGVGGTWWAATGWSMGNPHLVVADVEGLDRLDLSAPPAVDPPEAFPTGVNVEFAHASDGRGHHLAMRVYERGVGETRSCGTGACAVAVAAMSARGERTCYDVDVPGGRLRVEWLDDGRVLLTGPAVIVADGEYRGDRDA